MSEARRGGRVILTSLVALAVLGLALATAGCGGGTEPPADDGTLDVVATTSVLADIAQNVAGDRFVVEALIPRGTDPHAFEPTPDDLRRIAGAHLVIINGAGLEGTLEKYLNDVDEGTIVVASKGLTSRTPKPGEPGHAHDHEGEGEAEEAEADPHFWLDPILVQTYANTIAAAFENTDPDHDAEYQANAAAYDEQLAGLDRWIKEEVATVPADRRKLIMNHASHGYWADRYGFAVVGAVIPSVSTGSAPTAQDLADLLATIEREDVPAIFVEVGENPQLADQIAEDAGIAVVTDLFTGSLSAADGEAPAYIDMMRYNTRRIVAALKR